MIVSNAGRIGSHISRFFQSDISRIVIFSTGCLSRKYQAALREKATLRLKGETPTADLKLRMLQTLRDEYRVRQFGRRGWRRTTSAACSNCATVDQLNLTLAPTISARKNTPTPTGTSTEFPPATSFAVSLPLDTVVGDRYFASYRTATEVENGRKNFAGALSVGQAVRMKFRALGLRGYTGYAASLFAEGAELGGVAFDGLSISSLRCDHS
mgnify:CR=1 FL=1